MNITNITDDNITYSNNMTLCNCTNNDNDNINIDIVIPLLTIIPCVMSIICLLSIGAYSIIKPLFNKKSTL